MLLFAALLIVLQDPGIPQVVAAIAQAAQENAAKPEKGRASGDALADLYVRRACAAGQPAKAIVLGLAYALEPTGIVAKNPLVGDAFKDVESADARKARLAAQGKPTLRGREDWLAHFVVSAGLVVIAGEAAAEAAGIQKELSDAVLKEEGSGSGFSFTDLNADFAGIAFAKRLTGSRSKDVLAACRASFVGARFLPDPKGLADGLTMSGFEQAWGGVSDPRFRAECERLRRAAEESETTRFALPNGREVALPGHWTRRDVMWEDAALLYFKANAFVAIDGGSAAARVVYQPGRRDGYMAATPVWSKDLTACTLDFDRSHGIATIDLATGAARSRLVLPKHRSGDRDHFDPSLVDEPLRDADSDHWLLALQEERNEDVYESQRESWRTGGHWIVELSAKSEGCVALSGDAALPGQLWEVALAPARRRIYAIENPRAPDRCVLRELDLRGVSTGRFDVELRCVHDLAVSPDERWLLLERRDHTSSGFSAAHEASPDARWGQLQAAIAGGRDGFVLFDLEHDEIVPVSGSGHDAVFSPDGREIAFLDGYMLRLFDLASRRLVNFVVGDVADEPRPSYWGTPRWSLAGRRIAFTPPASMKEGERDELCTLALDLAAKEALLLDHCNPDGWSPIARPFGAGIRFDPAAAPPRWRHPADR